MIITFPAFQSIEPGSGYFHHERKDCLIKIPVSACLLTGFLFSCAAAAQDGRAESLAWTCYTCHSGRSVENGGIPSLESLDRGELIRRLKEFRDGETDATVMNRISAAYTDEETGIIADYIAAGKERQ